MSLTASEYVGNIRDTVKSFWHGMSVTLSQVLRRPITVQYPDRIEVPIQDEANVFPMVPPGAANHQTITAPELQTIASHA